MPNVQLYTLSTCPWCRKAKKFFTDREVPFDFVDVDLVEGTEKDAVVDTVYRLSGGLQYPVVVIGETVIAGYNPDKYSDVLGISRDWQPAGGEQQDER
jgi:glutaredoxin